MVTFNRLNIGRRGSTSLFTSAALVGLLFAPPSHATPGVDLSGEAASVASADPDSALSQLIDTYLSDNLTGPVLDPAGAGGAYAEISELGQAAFVAINSDTYDATQDVESAIIAVNDTFHTFEFAVSDVTGIVSAAGAIGSAF